MNYKLSYSRVFMSVVGVCSVVVDVETVNLHVL